VIERDYAKLLAETAWAPATCDCLVIEDGKKAQQNDQAADKVRLIFERWLRR